MKKLWIYSGICFILVLVSLFLPYTLHDLSGVKDIQTAGLEVDMALLLLPALIVISLIVLIKKNLATGIIGFILGFLLLLYMWLIHSILKWNLYWLSDFQESYSIHTGYYLALFAVAAYWFLLLINMIVLARNRNLKPSEIENPDLLDDSF